MLWSRGSTHQGHSQPAGVSQGHGETVSLSICPHCHRGRVKLGGFIGLRLNKTKSSPSGNESTVIFLRKLIELVITEIKDDRQGSV